MAMWRTRRASCGRPVAGLLLSAALAACGAGDAPERRAGTHLSFEDLPAPEVFAFRGPAERDPADGTGGLWATVPGLPRPERGLVVNEATGAEVVVALFRAGRAGTRLSGDAAEAIGIGDRPITVSITALRKKPRIDTTTGRF